MENGVRPRIGLAAVAHASRDPVGLVVVSGNGVQQLPHARGAVSLVSSSRARCRVPVGNSPIAPVLSGCAPHSNRDRKRLPRRRREVRRRAGEVAAAGGEVHAIHVVAEEEIDPPARSMLAVDPEDATISRPFVAESRALSRAIRRVAHRARGVVARGRTVLYAGSGCRAGITRCATGGRCDVRHQPRRDA
jgi:hypothetical protein